MLSEVTAETKKNTDIIFIDYTKAFDKVKHKEFLEVLENKYE